MIQVNQQKDKEQSSRRKKEAEKQKQDLFKHFFNLYEPNIHAIKQNQVPHEIRHLYQLIAGKPNLRTQRAVKKLKVQLSELKCFKLPPFNQTNSQFIQIFKRDSSNIINIISPFIDMTKYKKGSIVQVTAAKRDTIKILLMGQICAFEPANQRSFKTCQERIKNNEIDLTKISKIGVSSQQNDQDPSKQQNKNIYVNNESLILTSLQQDYINIQQQNSTKQKLTINDCRQILTSFNIISLVSPHKSWSGIKSGDFLFDKSQPMFIDQKPQYDSTFVCCSDCIFLEVNFKISNEAIYLINSDRQRPFIQSILFKFPMIKYFQAKQYVTQQFMITNQPDIEQSNQKPLKKSAIPIIKELKVVSSLNFQLSFTGQLYLIISGSVTMVISQISERKLSDIQYATSQKRLLNKQIFHLYKNDIFGFQEIGEKKSANLRYLVTIGSKLLKINSSIFRTHLETIKDLKQEYKKIKETRNQLIRQILFKMQSSLENQQIKRHQSITYSQSANNLSKLKVSKSMQLRSNSNSIMQLKYYGHESYQSASQRIVKHFSPQANTSEKQSLSPEIIKNSGLGIQFSKQLLKHPNQNIEIKDGWIQIRNKKGALLRRKKIKETSKELGQGKGDMLLRRLGVLNSQQIATHNHQIVKKRPSKYQFQDLNKEANQFKRIKEKMQNLPKLKNLYAKKEDRIFTILYKKTHM